MNQHVKYIPLGLLFAFGIKSLLVGFSWETVSASLIFAGLYAFLEARAESEKLKQLKAQLDAIEQTSKERDKIITDITTSISSLRMSTGLKPASFR